MLISRILRVFAVLLMLGLAGCDEQYSRYQQAPEAADKVEQARKDPLVQDLNRVGHAYAMHIDYHGRGPAGWEELIAVAKETNLDVDAIRRVRDKGYQVKWNVKLSEVTEGVSNFVLAEAASGPKLMLDGTIRID